MARNSIYDTRMLQLSVSMTAETLTRLQSISKKESVSISSLIRPWIEKGLNKEYSGDSDTENDENLGDA